MATLMTVPSVHFSATVYVAGNGNEGLEKIQELFRTQAEWRGYKLPPIIFTIGHTLEADVQAITIHWVTPTTNKANFETQFVTLLRDVKSLMNLPYSIKFEMWESQTGSIL